MFSGKQPLAFRLYGRVVVHKKHIYKTSTPGGPEFWGWQRRNFPENFRMLTIKTAINTFFSRCLSTSLSQQCTGVFVTIAWPGWAYFTYPQGCPAKPNKGVFRAHMRVWYVGRTNCINTADLKVNFSSSIQIDTVESCFGNIKRQFYNAGFRGRFGCVYCLGELRRYLWGIIWSPVEDGPCRLFKVLLVHEW